MANDPFENSSYEPYDPQASSFGRMSPEAVMRRGRMGEAYIRANRLTEAQVEQIIAAQQRKGIRFGEAAIELGLLSEQEVNEALGRQFSSTAYVSVGVARNIHRSLAIVHAPDSQDAEAIRRLRSEVLARMERESRFALALVSPTTGEGKSHTAASLAIAFAQIGVKTLLVDANLRSSVLHQWFSAPNQTGLSTMLARRSEVSLEAVHKVFPGLWLLTAGPLPPNPSEILSPPKFSALLSQFGSDINLFIIDTPALLNSADGQTIARQSGHALMVVRKNLSKIEDVRESVDDLQNLGVQIVGTVYNERPEDGDRRAGAKGSLLGRLASSLGALFRGRRKKVFD